MSILSLRTSVKKRRWLLIVIFVVLVIGLLGVYATNGRTAPDVTSKVDYNAQIASYQSAIDTARITYQEKANDYASINALAELLYNQAGVYIDAASQAATDGDTAKSTEYSDKSKPVYAEAAKLFEEAYANTPEGLNNTGKAQLIVKAANSYAMAGENEKAETKYLLAKETDSTNYEVAMSYTQFLVSVGRYQDAKQELQVYKALLPADSTYLQSIDSAIETLKQLIEANGKVAEPSFK
jgi:predicted Zn-dependent protease